MSFSPTQSLLLEVPVEKGKSILDFYHDFYYNIGIMSKLMYDITYILKEIRSSPLLKPKSSPEIQSNMSKVYTHKDIIEMAQKLNNDLYIMQS